METPDARSALLAGLIDHAPTFPPTSLAPDAALAEDARALTSTHAWVLARLVWPASRLDDLPGSQRAVSAVLDEPLALFGDAEAALAESDADAFVLDPSAFSWRGRAADARELERVRSELLHSIGSCSFFEPIQDLQAQRMLPR